MYNSFPVSEYYTNIHEIAFTDIPTIIQLFIVQSLVVCVTEFRLPGTIINIQKYLFENMYLGKEDRCLHVIRHSSIVINSLSMHQLLNG